MYWCSLSNTFMIGRNLVFKCDNRENRTENTRLLHRNRDLDLPQPGPGNESQITHMLGQDLVGAIQTVSRGILPRNSSVEDDIVADLLPDDFRESYSEY